MRIPGIVLYTDSDFGGDEWATNLSYSWVGSDWNDSISSLVVISGTWQFYGDADYSGTYSRPLGPGMYPFVEDDFVNIWNDSISSFKVVDWNPGDVSEFVTVDTIDGLNWIGTGYTGTVVVSNDAADDFNNDTPYHSYGINPQSP